jgi:hypothetical protein
MGNLAEKRGLSSYFLPNEEAEGLTGSGYTEEDITS